MEGAGKTVEDDELREAMQEKGLGTPATRSSIIEGLIAEKYMLREGRELIPTAKSFQLMTLLRGLDVQELTKAELTGEWEYKLAQMEQGKLSREKFMAEIAAMTERMVKKAKEYDRDTIPGDYATLQSPCPNCGGVVKEKTFHRAAIVKFTLYEELIKAGSDNVVMGVKLSKKDRDLFKKLFERAIPGIDNPQHYSTGSNANVAPFMDSMMNTFLKLFSITNDMVENYKVVFSIPNLMTVPMEWSDELMDIDSLSSIVRLVPPQRGNEGDSRVDEKLREEHSANMGNFKSTAEKDAAGNNFNRPQPTPQQPEPQKPAVNPNGTVSFNSGVATSFNQHQQQPTTFVPPWENQPVTGFGNNQVQANNGKVSFSSLAVGQQTQSSFQGFQNQGRNTPFGGSSFGGGFSGV
jgi:hypothetical protein